MKYKIQAPLDLLCSCVSRSHFTGTDDRRAMTDDRSVAKQDEEEEAAVFVLRRQTVALPAARH